jgi:hypothetical protein
MWQWQFRVSTITACVSVAVLNTSVGSKQTAWQCMAVAVWLVWHWQWLVWQWQCGSGWLTVAVAGVAVAVAVWHLLLDDWDTRELARPRVSLPSTLSRVEVRSTVGLGGWQWQFDSGSGSGMLQWQVAVACCSGMLQWQWHVAVVNWQWQW